MNAENRKGSVLTAVIAACLFFLILGLFSKSIRGEHVIDTTAATEYVNTVPTPGSTKIGAGFYQMTLHEEAKYQFMPPLNDLE